ncbi:NADP-dependent oxidoreductase domain-containing protein [Pisolithus orientalis]|uniref:NADP-dependent oxidoreductase domain-containing protein n=1 Tax=Pisolithus orientalis TaxID=936130 RepID=UPI00222418E2|nr:NADP-dependent oxidoreductase domain-containing protein [Pisolithus orientalis]KAI6019787.1 NADP-dependent oxidoreductase domain-containing protein [Pisolithus orientalis]
MSYPTRNIGDTDVSAIGFGAMGLSAFYGPTEPDEERFKVLDAALDYGCTLWDTANAYGDSEELIGKWFTRTGKRDRIFLATKFGFDISKPSGINGSPEHAEACLEASLSRLCVETIDLYYLHRPDPEVPIEVTVGAMAKSVKAGKVKYLGLCECSANTLRRAHAVHPIAALQVEYSPFTLDIEDPKIGLLQTARELGITIVAYSPVGRGLLTGQYKSPDDFAEDDYRRHIPRYSKENFPNILKLADKLKELGQHHNATAAQVALAWDLAQGNDIIPIPGTKRIKYLKENLDSVHVHLLAEEIQEIRTFVEKANLTVGDRHPPTGMKTLYADTPELK